MDGGVAEARLEYFGFFPESSLGEILLRFLPKSSSRWYCQEGARLRDTRDSFKWTKEVGARGAVLGRGGRSRDCQFYSEGENGLGRVVRCSEMKPSGNFWGGGAKLAMSGFPSLISLNHLPGLVLVILQTAAF